MRLIDTDTGCVVGTITTNHSMSIDDALDLLGYDLDEEGQLVDDDGDYIDAWYENLDFDWEDEEIADNA